MTIKSYYLLTDSRKQLSKNFIVNEFACHDGTLTVKIDSDLVTYLQKIRDYFGKPIIITSAYRTVVYNRKINGATYSKHTTGQAADFYIKGVNLLLVAQYAEKLGILGIGYYPTDKFVHIDTRKYKSYWKHLNRKNNEVYSFND
nr:MAG: hypothetical protein [Microvirus sp.]